MTPLITNIVFTKNRPLQLNAYLESLYRHFPAERITTHVLYKPERFDTEYESLFRRFHRCRVIRESDFHTDCLDLIRSIETPYTMFGVDDVVWFDSVDIDLIDRTFTEHADDIFGFTFRFSPRSLDGTGQAVETLPIGDTEVYRLDWPQGATDHTRYPFELNGTLYSTALVRRIIDGAMSASPLARRLCAPNAPLIRALRSVVSPRKILKSFGFFFSPNTLESWNCRYSQRNAASLPRYTYFQKLCACAVQVNVVNTSTASSPWGDDQHTVETLNRMYRDGYRFDIDALEKNKPTALSGGPELFKLTRPPRM